MPRSSLLHAGVLSSLLGACATPEPWLDQGPAEVLSQARRRGLDTIVYFALPGRDLSEQMEAVSLPSPEVLTALDQGRFASMRLDGFDHQRLYSVWIGGGEGMGVCALDRQGRVYAARPGPQDPPDLAAWIRLCQLRREGILEARSRVESNPQDLQAQYELGCRLLEVGCRVGTIEALVTAAEGGVLDARHRLARVFALEGRLVEARRWLELAPPSPERAVTEGYILFKERRHHEAVVVLHDAVQRHGPAGDKPMALSEIYRARLYLGKSLHEVGRSDLAVDTLEALVAEAPGTTYAGAALHTLNHIRNPDHGHTH